MWNDREFTVNKRSIIKKEATLTALGASGAVISKHFDVIIGDRAYRNSSIRCR